MRLFDLEATSQNVLGESQSLPYSKKRRKRNIALPESRIETVGSFMSRDGMQGMWRVMRRWLEGALEDSFKHATRFESPTQKNLLTLIECLGDQQIQLTEVLEGLWGLQVEDETDLSGLRRADVQRAAEDGRVIVLDIGESRLVPVFQFDDRGTLILGVGRVNQQLDAGHAPWSAAHSWSLPDPALGGRSLLERIDGLSSAQATEVLDAFEV